jgi:hypothetical protein
MALFEIFDNRQRLIEDLALVHEHGHERARVELAKLRAKLLAREQVHRFVLVFQTFEIERDAHPPRGGASKVAVELQHVATSIQMLELSCFELPYN